MNLERFTELLDAYGSDLDRWPASEQAAATALLTDRADAREAQRRAAAVDTLLLRASLPDIEPSDALRQRVLAQVAHLAPAIATPASDWRAQIAEAFALLFPTGRRMPQFAAFALALMIGISAGFANFGLIEAQDADLVTVQIASATPLLSED
jgi:hypothetical protein